MLALGLALVACATFTGVQKKAIWSWWSIKGNCQFTCIKKLFGYAMGNNLELTIAMEAKKHCNFIGILTKLKDLEYCRQEL